MAGLMGDATNGRTAARPAIGITSPVETVRCGAWTERTAATPWTYVASVQRAGGRAVILPPDERDTADPHVLLDSIDGLIVSGGAGDVDPRRYGQAVHPETAPEDALRDEFELALVAAARERGMPLLGVCRGLHVMTVAYGGELEQHLPDLLGADRHRGAPGVFAEHEVELEEGSLAARAVGARTAIVQSHHHQGIRRLPAGLRACGRAAGERTVEAVEDPAHPFALGVLWHPEEDESSGVIGALVRAAAAAHVDSPRSHAVG
jgi:putative glutamine amidotransferase